jgi:restriction endonuclease Mrr
MGIPSSQVAAVWVKQELESTEWTLLREVLFKAVKKKLLSLSEEELWDYAEANLVYVAEHLRDAVAECLVDGTIPSFEIDDEPSPYVRATSELPSDVLCKLRRIDPFELESICAKLLDALGATSHATQKTNDGGIDFVGVNLKIVPSALTIPASCKAAVIGQTKRYNDKPISETRVREFVGAATLKRHQLWKSANLGPFAPVVFAFWTTSDFEPNAKQYARDVGVWYMDGLTLAAYVSSLGLRDYVMSLPDERTQSVKSEIPSEAELLSESKGAGK